MKTSWYASPYTGIVTDFGAVPPRPHDPGLHVASGAIAAVPLENRRAVSGAGWSAAEAEGACVGEAVERMLPHPLPRDRAIEASAAAWPLDEEAIGPERWVLFHPDQYAQAGFPFEPFTARTACRWTNCREARSGRAVWIPEEFCFLAPRPGEKHRLAAAVSTGMSCGRPEHPVLLRGLQEVIERDAVVGAWWGRYPLEEWDGAAVFASLGDDVRGRALRPNLTYRFYRVVTPWSSHATIVSVAGEDREGFCFYAGSACRETRAASWRKSLVEAIQGRFYVRLLKSRFGVGNETVDELSDFAHHAAYYSYHPDRLARTALHRPQANVDESTAATREELSALAERLGPRHPVLFRAMTPPMIAQEIRDWTVLRIIVPGLQPLHGHARLAHLGGPLWQPRGLADWNAHPPHPFA